MRQRIGRQEVIDQIYRQYALWYEKHGLIDDRSKPDAYDDTLYTLLRRFEIKPGDAIVDLACGDGRKLASLRKDGYERLNGCDKHVDASSSGISHTKQDILDFLQSSEMPINCIILYDIIEHFDLGLIVEVLKASTRRLAEGGIIILRTPNGASPLCGLYYAGDVTHETLLNEYSISQLAFLSGLRLDQVMSEGVEGRRYSRPKRLAARFGNRVLRILLAALSLLAFRGRHPLTPNLVAVLIRDELPK